MPDYILLICMLVESSEVKFNEYFSHEGSSSESLHCTAFFSNRGRTRNSSEYASQDVVKKSLGKTYALAVVGFVITPQTIGARVALNSRQGRLWGKDDFEGTDNKGDSNSSRITDSPIGANHLKSDWKQVPGKSDHSSPVHTLKKAATSNSKPSKGASVSNPFAALGCDDEDDEEEEEDEAETSEVDSDVEAAAASGDEEEEDEDDDKDEVLEYKMLDLKLSERPRFLPTSGFGSRAHITLGYAKGSTAVQTGLNQIQVIEREQECDACTHKRPKHFELDGAAVIHYGDGQCVVYLNEPIRATTLFSGRY